MKIWSTQAKNEITMMANQFKEILDVIDSFKDQVTETFGEHVDNANRVNAKIYDLEKQKDINIEKVEEIRLEVKEAFKDQDETIDRQEEKVNECIEKTCQVVIKSNDHHKALTDLCLDMEKLKHENNKIVDHIEASKFKGNMETKEPENIKLENEQEDIEVKNEIIETVMEQPNQDTEKKVVISAAQQNKSL